jgi:hypothetical protein
MEVHDGREEEIRGIRLAVVRISLYILQEQAAGAQKAKRSGFGGAF